jgi:serine/threonine-protein kinase
MREPQALWLVADRYFVGSVVGRGGYGMVCRGVDRKTGRPVALKMLSPEAGKDRDAVERMIREQQALVALTGTCAVTAIDLCRLESGAPCLVMEWLEGRDLEASLSEQETAGRTGRPEALLALLAPLAETLDRAHAIGIVHRDLKPANVFLTSAAPGVRLLDFGLARMTSSAPLTGAGMIMGSPSYIAPESWRGNSTEIDGRADLYSLAVIAFRYLTGRLPFDAPDLVGKMLAATSAPRPSVTSHNPTLPPAADAWVARALAIDPGARFQSAQEWVQALATALAAPQPAASAKPRVLVDAKDAFAAAFRSAGELLKRFTQPASVKSTPPPTPAEAPPAHQANTVWLDSEELAPVHQANTVWLDSEELAPVHQANTVWLDSSELSEVSPAQLAASEPKAGSALAKKQQAKQRSRKRVTSTKRRKSSPRKSGR